MTREIINIKINKVMTRKKRTKEEQPLTTEVVGAKKKSPKKKKAVEEKPVVVQEQEASVNEPTTQENVAENTPEKREYTIDELIDMLGPDIECEDEAEVEDTSSSEREDNGEDIFAALDDWDEDDDEEISDEIIDMFDKTLEEKGLGDAYFERLERNIKEHEEAQKERELYIDEVKWILLIITTIGLLLAISLRICLMRKVGLYSIRLVVFIPIMTMMKLIVNIPL
jgi:DNA replicative helicase MCM subunit Mcm2 (Cdc46/Mcm family)